jgi:hypothetical protein
MLYLEFYDLQKFQIGVSAREHLHSDGVENSIIQVCLAVQFENKV